MFSDNSSNFPYEKVFMKACYGTALRDGRHVRFYRGRMGGIVHIGVHCLLHRCVLHQVDGIVACKQMFLIHDHLRRLG